MNAVDLKKIRNEMIVLINKDDVNTKSVMDTFKYNHSFVNSNNKYKLTYTGSKELKNFGTLGYDVSLEHSDTRKKYRTLRVTYHIPYGRDTDLTISEQFDWVDGDYDGNEMVMNDSQVKFTYDIFKTIERQMTMILNTLEIK